MDNHYLNSPTSGDKLFQSLGIILRLIGFVIVGGVTATLLYSVISGIGVSGLQEIASNPSQDTKLLLWGLQGINQLFMFIVLPLLYIYFFNKNLAPQFLKQKDKLGIYALMAILLIFSSIPIINLLSEFNKAIQLPDFMAGVERWMKSKEYAAEKFTDAIAYYSNNVELIYALIIVAVLPAVGEELMFRGIMQNEFNTVFKNPHIAIWLSGFIFSFIHLQFYGFFPRMFLGVTFGYLYFWSGNLLIPILVHFLNNALTLIAINLYKQRILDVDPESAESIPAYSIIISLIFFSVLLFTFKKFKKQTP